jgi:glutathione synthase/RimK-type ligase-like ATP-grasp enzyme
LGVDIVLDKNRGPLILELNARPGLSIQIANGTGAIHRYELIDQQKEKRNIAQRVSFSMQAFGQAQKIQTNAS